jgi:hypothetical protein
VWFRWFRKRKWHDELAGCDFEVARSLMRRRFAEMSLRTELANRLDRFEANPCFATAAALLDVAPQLRSVFESSKRGSTYGDWMR